ncbi:Uncharacterised protein [Providencia rettgeri]|nr:Uncharacterised protein [Providencia rettgeri]
MIGLKNLGDVMKSIQIITINDEEENNANLYRNDIDFINLIEL